MRHLAAPRCILDVCRPAFESPSIIPTVRVDIEDRSGIVSELRTFFFLWWRARFSHLSKACAASKDSGGELMAQGDVDG